MYSFYQQYNKQPIHRIIVVKIYIIYNNLMKTKSIKKIQKETLTSSRKLRSQSQRIEQIVQLPQKLHNSDLREDNNQIDMQDEFWLKLKIEKESTSPINNEELIINSNQKSRRTTRSLFNISNKISDQLGPLADQLTPQDNAINQIQGQEIFITSKSAQAEEVDDVYLLDINLPVKKISTKAEQKCTSPYSEFRKSYRKLHRKEIVTVPYRKCHDALEGRIVTIMNKLENGKICIKDFENLTQKISKIAQKDLLNRFIISGIRTIISTSLQNGITDSNIIKKLQQEEIKLQQKIKDWLETYDQFQMDYQLQNNGQRLQNNSQYKALLIKKMYQIMRKKYPERKKEMRQRIRNECQRLFQGEINMNLIIKFVRDKLK